MQQSEHMQDYALKIENLSVSFNTIRGEIRAVQNLSLAIRYGETFALVGESGCGKSVTAQTINRIIPQPPGIIKKGSIYFEGKDLTTCSTEELHAIRGTRISMIFQEPMTSLNPLFTIGKQIAAVFLEHTRMSKKEAYQKTAQLLEAVQLPEPYKQIYQYPHQISGGMQQRVMIAMALASPDPCLLIADEPTTALDATTQIQILALLQKLQQENNLSILLITHDMGIVAHYADRVAVMYAGRKVEEGNIEEIFATPMHPYTQGLLASLPQISVDAPSSRKKRLQSIEGSVPDLRSIGNTCPFYSRCTIRSDQCTKAFPINTTLSQSHAFWCYNAKKEVTSYE